MRWPAGVDPRQLPGHRIITQPSDRVTRVTSTTRVQSREPKRYVGRYFVMHTNLLIMLYSSYFAALPKNIGYIPRRCVCGILRIQALLARKGIKA